MAASRPTEPAYREQALTPVRRAISDRVLKSHSEIPVFHLHAELDAEPLAELRASLKGEMKPPPSINDLILKICAVTLREHPLLNAAYVGDTIRLYEEYNIGFAVATEKGVLVPVVKQADTKSLAEIAAETREMIDQAREGRLRASLQSGGTFSISNIGPGKVTSFNAIISPPQSAILAVGSLAPRPFVVDGELVVRRTLWLTLTVDHRVIDGADGGAFLNDLVANTATPRRSCGLE